MELDIEQPVVQYRVEEPAEDTLAATAVLAALIHPEPAHNVVQYLKVSVEQAAEDSHAAVVHPEPAHDVVQDLKVSVEQAAEDTHAAVVHPEPAQEVGQDLKVSVEQPAEHNLEASMARLLVIF